MGEKEEAPKHYSAGGSSRETKGSSTYRSVSDDELHHVLEEHRDWLLSGGKKGKKADLSHTDLRRASFADADLCGVNFRDSDLTGARFGQADVTNSIFHHAILDEANLASVKNLLPSQLAGASLARAALPENHSVFDGTRHATRISALGRTTFLTIIGACVFSWLVLGTTKNVELLTNRSAEILPVINFELPIIGFFIVAPFILFILYIYLNLYLMGLWEELSCLPAVFQDGRLLDQHVEPWLLTSVIHTHVPILKKRRPSLSGFRERGAVLAAWWLAPLTLGLFWILYLPRQEIWGTIWHLVLLITAVTFGIITYQVGKAKLQGKSWSGTSQLPTAEQLAPFDTLRIRRIIFCTIAGFCIALGISFLAGRVPPASRFELINKLGVKIPILQAIDQFRHLDIENAEISLKPPNWREISEPDREDNSSRAELERRQDQYLKSLNNSLREIVAAELIGRDMRYARAKGAFLANAHLRGAHLEGAELVGADLRKADLSGAYLTETIFSGAKMVIASLRMAHLRGTKFGNADLRGANLNNVKLGAQPLFLKSTSLKSDFTDANLQKALLQCADLPGSVFAGADLTNATLFGANLENADLRAANLTNTVLTNADLRGANFTGANLENAAFRGADLRSAKGIKSEQIKLACGDNKTKLPDELEIPRCQIVEQPVSKSVCDRSSDKRQPQGEEK